MFVTVLVALSLLALCDAYAAGIRPQYNMSKCPSFHELRADHVASDFDAEKHIPGYYYELALHDLTQYPLCPSKPRCITANKTLGTHSDGQRYVDDAWNLFCLGKYYPQVLLFNTTSDEGYFKGYVPTTKIPFLPKGLISKMVFPDTVVDFKDGPDGWLLEFQCIEKFGRVLFTGINFYSKSNSEAAYEEILAAGTAAGIDFFWNKGKGLTRVNQTGCPAPPAPKLILETISE